MTKKKAAPKKAAPKKQVVKKLATKPGLIPVKKITPPPPPIIDDRQLIIAFFFDGQPYNEVGVFSGSLMADELLVAIQEKCFNSFDEDDIKAVNEKLKDDSPRASADDINVISIFELI